MSEVWWSSEGEIAEKGGGKGGRGSKTSSISSLLYEWEMLEISECWDSLREWNSWQSIHPLDSDDRKGGGGEGWETKRRRERRALKNHDRVAIEREEGVRLSLPTSSLLLLIPSSPYSFLVHDLPPSHSQEEKGLRPSNLLSGIPSSKPLIEVDRLMDWWKEEKLRLYGRMMSHRNYCLRLKWARNYNGEMTGRKRLLFSCSDCLYEWRERKS